jgi:AraC-like DNA-binding protein
MFQRFFAPAVDLAPFVSEYVIIHNGDCQTPLKPDKYIPEPGGGMVFHFRQPTILLNGDLQITLPKHFVFGPRDRFLFMQPPADFDLLIVKFKPVGIFHCLDISPSALSGKFYTEFETIGGIQASELIEAMQKVADVEMRIPLLEAYFRDCVARVSVKKNHCDVDQIIERILETNGCEKLNELCNCFRIEMRTLRRHFVNRIGFSPKSFSRIVRINKICQELEMNPDIDISDLVFRYNYFDQAHLINDFNNILGETPLSFRNKDKHYLKFISALK